ncbi:hypothetical protein ENBRE01_0285 [Enteropsectra breve]|nr:hypothetical protein ENBRE01_0285 [Enteropsectra breve]
MASAAEDMAVLAQAVKKCYSCKSVTREIGALQHELSKIASSTENGGSLNMLFSVTDKVINPILACFNQPKLSHSFLNFLLFALSCGYFSSSQANFILQAFLQHINKNKIVQEHSEHHLKMVQVAHYLLQHNVELQGLLEIALFLYSFPEIQDVTTPLLLKITQKIIKHISIEKGISMYPKCDVYLVQSKNRTFKLDSNAENTKHEFYKKAFYSCSMQLGSIRRSTGANISTVLRTVSESKIVPYFLFPVFFENSAILKESVDFIKLRLLPLVDQYLKKDGRDAEWIYRTFRCIEYNTIITANDDEKTILKNDIGEKIYRKLTKSKINSEFYSFVAQIITIRSKTGILKTDNIERILVNFVKMTFKDLKKHKALKMSFLTEILDGTASIDMNSIELSKIIENAVENAIKAMDNSENCKKAVCSILRFSSLRLERECYRRIFLNIIQNYDIKITAIRNYNMILNLWPCIMEKFQISQVSTILHELDFANLKIIAQNADNYSIEVLLNDSFDLLIEQREILWVLMNKIKNFDFLRRMLIIYYSKLSKILKGLNDKRETAKASIHDNHNEELISKPIECLYNFLEFEIGDVLTDILMYIDPNSIFNHIYALTARLEHTPTKLIEALVEKHLASVDVEYVPFIINQVGEMSKSSRKEVVLIALYLFEEIGEYLISILTMQHQTNASGNNLKENEQATNKHEKNEQATNKHSTKLLLAEFYLKEAFALLGSKELFIQENISKIILYFISQLWEIVKPETTIYTLDKILAVSATNAINESMAQFVNLIERRENKNCILVLQVMNKYLNFLNRSRLLTNNTVEQIANILRKSCSSCEGERLQELRPFLRHCESNFDPILKLDIKLRDLTGGLKYKSAENGKIEMERIVDESSHDYYQDSTETANESGEVAVEAQHPICRKNYYDIVDTCLRIINENLDVDILKILQVFVFTTEEIVEIADFLHMKILEPQSRVLELCMALESICEVSDEPTMPLYFYLKWLGCKETTAEPNAREKDAIFYERIRALLASKKKDKYAVYTVQELEKLASPDNIESILHVLCAWNWETGREYFAEYSKAAYSIISSTVNIKLNRQKEQDYLEFMAYYSKELLHIDESDVPNYLKIFLLFIKTRYSELRRFSYNFLFTHYSLTAALSQEVLDKLFNKIIKQYSMKGEALNYNVLSDVKYCLKLLYKTNNKEALSGKMVEMLDLLSIHDNELVHIIKQNLKLILINKEE